MELYPSLMVFGLLITSICNRHGFKRTWGRHSGGEPAFLLACRTERQARMDAGLPARLPAPRPCLTLSYALQLCVQLCSAAMLCSHALQPCSASYPLLLRGSHGFGLIA